jgi:phospholipase C
MMRLTFARSGATKRAAIALIATGLMVSQAAAVSAQNSRATLKNFQHVFVIMMENTGYDLLLDNPNAPWTNHAAKTYGVATDSYGVTHPSQPNYMAITSGSTAGVLDDGDTTADVPNIVDQLEAHGKTWTDYQESLSLCNGNLLASSCGNQLYERKHNPFVTYDDIRTNPSRMTHVVDLSQLSSDLASGHVADYNFIAPNQCHDMHGRYNPGVNDPCDYSSPATIISTGDAFLGDLVGEIMSSPAWNGNSVIFVTWDESEYTGSDSDFGFGDTSGCCTANPGGGHVMTIVVSHSDHAPRTSDTSYNHYSVLATIQEGWKLGCLEATCDPAVVPMADLVGPKK